MASPDQKTEKNGKGFHLEFSHSFIFFAGLGLIFLLGWIFILGILVGRGFVPKGVKTLSELRVPITKFQDMVSRKAPSHDELINESEKDPKFVFYDELSKKKEEVSETKHQAKDKKVFQPKAEIKLTKIPPEEAVTPRAIETEKKGRSVMSENQGSSQKEEAALPEKTTVGEIQQSRDKDLKKESQLITAGRTDKKPTARKSEDKLITKPGQHQTEYLYALQIASLESEIKAADMVNRLESLGYPAYFYKSYIKGKAFYRVRCGPFKNEKEAGDFKKLLHKRENIESFISKIAK